MTLSTNVYVLDEVSHLEVFLYCQSLLRDYDSQGRGPDRQRWRDEQDQEYRNGRWAVYPDSSWTIENELGQGLPAWLILGYRPGAPLRTAEQVAVCDEDCEPDCDRSRHDRPCWLDVDFDTAYGYDHDGMGCGDLHAVLVARLGQWLDARGVRWEWRNEFSGEVHGGEDRYERLIDLASGGFEATAWYRSTVLPAIERGAV